MSANLPIKQLFAATASILAAACTEPAPSSATAASPDPFLVEAIVEIRAVHCAVADTELAAQGLVPDGIATVRAFCALSAEEMLAELEARVARSEAVSATFTYTCAGGWVSGIPSQADLGLSSTTCTWHDPNPVACKQERGVACLWGCNNVDPVLGWHTKSYASRTAAETDLRAKGYRWLSTAGDFSREIGYGYRYQVHLLSGTTWHSEGPEPSPAFSWSAYVGGWWPSLVQQWHTTC